MAMGRRDAGRQQDLFVTTDQLPKSIGHVFYGKLNELLAEAGFDAWVEQLCEKHYAERKGRPGVPPGVYFRMLLVGYFEGIQSQRGIAWRCADSLSLRRFLGIQLTVDTPDHSSLSYIRERLPRETHDAVFAWVLKLAVEKQLLKGKTVAVDSSSLEASAAMKSIVRRDSGEDWKEYVIRLMKDEGVVASNETPTDEEVRNYDKKREDKKVSNDEWVSPVDPDARITRMKDGTTHLAYKAENVVDLESNLVLAAEVYHGDRADAATLEDSVHAAQTNQHTAGSEAVIADVVADKGYHSADTLATIAEHTPYRTYIPEPKRAQKDQRKKRRKGNGKPPAQRRAVLANRRRMKGNRGKGLQKLRSEIVERTFAHLLETGGARRTWLRGIDKVRKRYSLAAAAHNLGVLMRKLFGIGTPRSLQQFQMDLAAALSLAHIAYLALWRRVSAFWTCPVALAKSLSGGAPPYGVFRSLRENAHFSTGC